MSQALMENRHGSSSATLTVPRAALALSGRGARGLDAPRAGRSPWGPTRTRTLAISSCSCVNSEGAARSSAYHWSALSDRPRHHQAPPQPHSKWARHRLEEVFTSAKTIAGQTKTKCRRLDLGAAGTSPWRAQPTT
jgi:hypothetical protein